MKLTMAQERHLRWLYDAGGVAHPHGLVVKALNKDDHTGTGAAISFLHLVAKGLVEAHAGTLRITEYGKRQLGVTGLRPTPPPDHSAELAATIARDIFRTLDFGDFHCSRVEGKAMGNDKRERDLGGYGEAPLAELIQSTLIKHRHY